MLSDEQLKTIEACGQAEMPLDETCEIAEITMDEFLNNETAVKMYKRGQLSSKLKIRQKIVKLAADGMPQMVKFYLDFMREKITLETTNDFEYDDEISEELQDNEKEFE